MFSAVAFTLALAPAGNPFTPEKYPTVYIPTDTTFGYLYAPAADVRLAPRMPATTYQPKAGDVILMSDTNRFWLLLYRLALTGRPGHGGIVVTMPDGRLGCLEAGYDGTLWTRLTPLDYKLHQFPGTIWIRQRHCPLTPDQDAQLTAFAVAAANKPYAVGKFALMATQLTPRGPFRTAHFGRPARREHRYTCAEIILEALLHAGLVNGRTVRPAASYPQDLFYDRSRNPYIDRHPPLAGGWATPAQWTPVVGWSIRGKFVPKPPSSWPGGAADVVQPVYSESNKPPVPVVVGHVAGELRPIALVEYYPKRVGFFDRPPLLRRRR